MKKSIYLIIVILAYFQAIAQTKKDIKPTVKKANNKLFTTWRKTNIEAIPLLESFYKTYSDHTNKIQFISIK